MIAAILVVFVAWAVAGVVTSVRAALAADGQVDSLFTAGTDRMSFGGDRRAAYRRWRDRLRRGMPGAADGSRPGHILADGVAAAIAGAALFAAGFGSGVAWATSRRSVRTAGRDNAREPAGPRPDPGTGRSRTGIRRSRRGPVIDGELLDPPETVGPPTPPGPIEDAELIDERPPTGNAEPGDVIDAELVDTEPATPDRPALRATPEPKGTAVTEILNIHQLFAWAKSVAEGTVQLVEHAVLRRNAAMARAERAVVVAKSAAEQAAQLEQAQARFTALNMDAASLASIAAAKIAAATLAACEQRHAEAEQMTAQTAAATATAAEAYQAAVNAMHTTVNTHQSPHAMAQAETGNAAAHSSVLAAS